jgi:hypothetical protein
MNGSSMNYEKISSSPINVELAYLKGGWQIVRKTEQLGHYR